jgi:hypothetical protein
LNFGFTEIFIVHCLIAVAMVIIIACDITHKKFTREALTFLLFFVTINRVLFDQTLINIVSSLTFGIVFSAIFYKLIYQKINYVFSNESQFLDYIKFILIASVALDYQSFLYYFFEVMFILLLLSFFKVFSKKNVISIGYVFVLPLLWLLIIQPINY